MPRLRKDLARTAFGVGAFVAASAFAGGIAAQTASETSPENGIFDPPNGQGVLNPEAGSEPPRLLLKNPPRFGKPPAHGAGKTGFDSTNPGRKIQAVAEKKKAQAAEAEKKKKQPTLMRPGEKKPDDQ